MNAMLAGQYSAYTNAKATTVSPAKQIVLLYEGLIKFFQQARKAIEDNKIEERFNTLNKALEVVIGLQNGLDFDKGGDVAHVLYQFYSEILYNINQIQKNKPNSIALCDDSIHQLKVMLESWKEVAEQEGAGAQKGAAVLPASQATAYAAVQPKGESTTATAASEPAMSTEGGVEFSA